MPLHRIYFDTNERHFDIRGIRYDLGLPGSFTDIAPIAGQLHEGMRVIIYMTGELEMEATLEFDRNSGGWMARPIEATTKIYPESFLPNSVEALRETIDRSLSSEATKFDLFVPRDLTLCNQPVSADVAMAIILDKLLGHGFEPAGFSQMAQGRVYHYKRV
jgi:hypothetical protein